MLQKHLSFLGSVKPQLYIMCSQANQTHHPLCPYRYPVSPGWREMIIGLFTLQAFNPGRAQPGANSIPAPG